MRSMSSTIGILPENPEEKFLFMKEKIEERFSKVNTSFPFEKPEIDVETLHILRELSNYWEVYYYTDSNFFKDPNSGQYLSSISFLISDINSFINKIKGKVFVFYSAKGKSIRGEFIESSEAINRHRDDAIDKLLY